jgi:ribosome biogenesis GTPase
MGKRLGKGLVIRVTGKEVWVDADGEVVPCLLRGRLRREGQGFQVVAGDRVNVTWPEGGGNGAIESVDPRTTWLSRYAGARHAGARDGVERVIVANIDTLFLVESLDSPRLSHRFVDRVLVSAESGHVSIRICLNKIDLGGDRQAIDEFVSVYEPLGYPVTPTSAVTGAGLEDVESAIEGGIYAFVGRSGVGKSSLLNRIDPDLNLRVGEVAQKTGRGKHTTTFSQLYPLKGGYVADTPGMQTFGHPGSDASALPECFPEFRPFLGGCRFHPCTHSHEPDCAVKQAVDDGAIAASRYESYLDMLAEIELREKDQY